VADDGDKNHRGSNGESTALVPQEEEGGIRFVKFAPKPPFDQRLVFWGQGSSPTAASFRLLRQRLIERGDPRTVLCTSARPSEGTTTLATNLALAFTELGKYRVLLLEATFRRASLGEVFGFKPPRGFALQLARHRDRPTEPWVVVQIATMPLYILAAEPRCCPHCATVITNDAARFCGMCGKDVGASDLGKLDSIAFGGAMQRFRSAFDYIIVDAPPVLASGEVNLIQDAADAIVFATNKGRSEARNLRRALDQVAPAPVAAVVLLDG
jgi:Mrp family chromosome partitioning ATPase